MEPPTVSRWAAGTLAFPATCGSTSTSGTALTAARSSPSGARNGLWTDAHASTTCQPPTLGTPPHPHAHSLPDGPVEVYYTDRNMFFLAFARIGANPLAHEGIPARMAFTHLQPLAHVLGALPAEDVKDTMDGPLTAAESLPALQQLITNAEDMPQDIVDKANAIDRDMFQCAFNLTRQAYPLCAVTFKHPPPPRAHNEDDRATERGTAPRTTQSGARLRESHVQPATSADTSAAPSNCTAQSGARLTEAPPG